MTETIPAILPTSYDDLVEHLGRVRTVAPYVQLDICDGLFVPTRTWPMNPGDRTHFAEILKGEEGLPYWQDFNFEIDLMVHNPEKFLSQWVAVGIDRAVVHLESKHNWHEVQDAAGGTVSLGLAIDLDPPFEKLHSYITRVDYIQIMGIGRLGRQGSELDERVFEVVRKIRAEFPDVTIQIDGGVSLENASRLLDAGADRLVVGSHIFEASDPKAALKEFQNL